LRTLVVFLAFLACLAASLAAAAPAPFASGPELGKWVTYYYLKPEPARAVEAIASASRLGLMKDGKSSPSMIGFLSGVMRKEPAVAREAASRLVSLPGAEQPVLALSLWYSGHPETGKLLAGLARSVPEQKEMYDELSQQAAPKLDQVPLDQGPWVLDALWGNFMATGDERPVLRVMSALPWVEAKGDKAKALAGGAARWSLTSNAVHHPRVLAICKAQVGKQPKEVSAVLAEIIRNAEKDLKARAGAERKDAK